jgi:hypothetical protein
MTKKTLSITIVVLTLLFVLVPAAAAAPAEQVIDPIPSLVDAITLLTTTAGLGVVISFVFSKRPWFEKLSSQAKFWLILLASIGIPLVAKILLDIVPANIFAVLEPYWQVIAMGFASFLASQWYHASTTKDKIPDDTYKG